MEEVLYHAIFKRKSFHLFKDVGRITQEELNSIRDAFGLCNPLIPEIKVEMKIVPAEQTTCTRGQEFCILLYSEKKEGYLPNIGYIGEQLDLILASMNIGALWFGIGKTDVESDSGLDFVIMMAVGKLEDGRFRKDMFKSKRKPLEEIWTGEQLDIANIVRFAPSACNTQPWIVENIAGKLNVYRYKKPGKRGIMPADRVAYYNRIDMGIFLLFLELCLKHEGISYERTLFPDAGDAEKTLTAVYRLNARETEDGENVVIGFHQHVQNVDYQNSCYPERP